MRIGSLLLSSSILNNQRKKVLGKGNLSPIRISSTTQITATKDVGDILLAWTMIVKTTRTTKAFAIGRAVVVIEEIARIALVAVPVGIAIGEPILVTVALMIVVLLLVVPCLGLDEHRR